MKSYLPIAAVLLAAASALGQTKPPQASTLSTNFPAPGTQQQIAQPGQQLGVAPALTTYNLSITNWSFQTPVGWEGTNAGGSWQFVTPGWTWATAVSTRAGVWAPSVLNFQTMPDGNQAAFVDYGRISQDLGVAPNVGTYTFSVYAGNRGDNAYGQKATYTAELYIGASPTPLCGTSTTSAQIPVGGWQQLLLTCQTHAPLPNGNLIVALSCSQYQCSYDAATLNFVPLHQAQLSWQDLINPATPTTTYNVYRATGQCGNNPWPAAFTRIAAAVPARTYTDFTIMANQNYCYAVTAVVSTTEGLPCTALYVPGQVSSCLCQ